MKRNLFVFSGGIPVVLLHVFMLTYAITITSCDSFLTCVTLPDNCHTACENSFFGKTFFSIRPQDSNSALRVTKIAHEDHSSWWGFEGTIGVQQSFSGAHNLLAQWFLFNGCTSVSVGIPNDRTPFDVDGRQLGLLTTDGMPGPLGKLALKPTIRNSIGILNAWFDLDDYLCGLWSRIYLTIAHTKTNLGMKSCTIDAAQSGHYEQGAYTTDCSEAPIAYTSVCAAFVGNKAIGVIPALQYGKLYTDTKTKTAVASIRFDVNYDITQSLDGFFNVGGCVVAPTGNRPHGRCLFEPIVGANKAWQLGATMLGAYTCVDDYEKNVLECYVDATLTYLFKSKQTRVFSLHHNGAGSQYMLLKTFDLSVGSVLAGERVANILAGQADIGGNVMFDGSFMVHFERCNRFFCDVGYNFWARSKEHIGNKACLRKYTENTYGVKGALPLSTVDSFSNLCVGDLTTASNATIGNPGSPDATTQVLDVCDINTASALNPSAFSNKLFASIGYSPTTCQCNATIHVFIEGEAEFGQKKRALNQWAVFVNVAVSL